MAPITGKTRLIEKENAAMDASNDVLFRVGGILHEARMTECYGKLQMSSRRAWPATVKEFRGQRIDGQPWIDVAVAQVHALVKAGLIQPTDAIEKDTPNV